MNFIVRQIQPIDFVKTLIKTAMKILRTAILFKEPNKPFDEFHDA